MMFILNKVAKQSLGHIETIIVEIGLIIDVQIILILYIVTIFPLNHIFTIIVEFT